MGITPFQADLIIQEHLRRPLPSTVHLLGRQTVRFDYGTARFLFARHNLTPAPVAVELDTTTLGAHAQNSDTAFISDTTFFKMFGVEKVMAIDHSDYEGAEIIVDLNKSLPDALKSCADFIYGGSVLDNIFDPAAYLRNITQLLKPGGRLVDHNTCTFREHPYIAISPAWYFDYCVVNRFARCDVYVSEMPRVACPAASHVYALDVSIDDPLIADGGITAAGMATYVTVVAEKGTNTDWQQVPSQDQYRSEEEWQRYREQLGRMRANQRFAKFCHPNLSHLGYPLRKVHGLRYLGCFALPLPIIANRLMTDEFWNDESLSGIRIVEATYGWNQRFEVISETALMALYRGNVTGILGYLFNGKSECDWLVDVNVIGDSAPGLPKDLTVLYFYTNDPDMRVRQIVVPEEAHGKRLVIPPFVDATSARDATPRPSLLRRVFAS